MSFFNGRKAVVLGGKTGLVGQALTRALGDAGAEVAATSRSSLDPLDTEALNDFLDREEPELIFNAVAYTQVDMAEDEPDAAKRLNASLPEHLVRLAGQRNARLIHFSTDFVFDGKKESPYVEEDATGPVSVYGKTKLQGEKNLLASGYDKILVIRTAWLFGPGRDNFVSKILKLAKNRETLAVVHDQSGSPTYTPDLAGHVLALVEAQASGIYNVVNAGRATWCELAGEAIKVAGLDCRIEAIPSSSYPTKARRPANSQLSHHKLTETTGVAPRPWELALRDYVYALLAEELNGD